VVLGDLPLTDRAVVFFPFFAVVFAIVVSLRILVRGFWRKQWPCQPKKPRLVTPG